MLQSVIVKLVILQATCLVWAYAYPSELPNGRHDNTTTVYPAQLPTSKGIEEKYHKLLKMFSSVEELLASSTYSRDKHSKRTERSVAHKGYCCMIDVSRFPNNKCPDHYMTCCSGYLSYNGLLDGHCLSVLEIETLLRKIEKLCD